MKRKFFSKTLAVLMVLVLAMSFATIIGSAVAGTSTTFNTYLTVDADAQIPATNFNFTVAAGTPIAGTASTYEVKAGPSPANVTVSTVSFTGAESTTAGTPSDSTDSTKKFASKTATVDLSGVNFTEPGVYRYVITETAGSTTGITYDTAPRYLDVYVQYDNGGNLEIGGYVLSDSAVARNLDDTSVAKSTGVKNSMTSYELTFTKAIEGNQADKTEAFTFTLNISNAADGTYTASDGTTITVSSGSGSATFTLTDGDTISVPGLTPGATCTVSETAGDYTPSIVIDNGSPISASSTGTITMNDNHQADFTNTREGVIPTGVILTVAPFAIGLLVAAAVIFFLIGRKKKREEA